MAFDSPARKLEAAVAGGLESYFIGNATFVGQDGIIIPFRTGDTVEEKVHPSVEVRAHDASVETRALGQQIDCELTVAVTMLLTDVGIPEEEATQVARVQAMAQIFNGSIESLQFLMALLNAPTDGSLDTRPVTGFYLYTVADIQQKRVFDESALIHEFTATWRFADGDPTAIVTGDSQVDQQISELNLAGEGLIGFSNGEAETLTPGAAKELLSLDQVDNTSDLAKPVSTAQAAAIAVAVAAETTRAEGVEGTLATQEALATEVTRAEGVEATLATQAALAVESAARVAGDAANATAIANEQARAEGAEATIAASVTAEAAARVAADTAIDASIAACVPESAVGQDGGVASLDSTGNVPSAQLGNVAPYVYPQGTWNATTNTPALPAPVAGNRGWMYYVTGTNGEDDVQGTLPDGSEVYIGDQVMSNGTEWFAVPVPGDPIDFSRLTNVPAYALSSALTAETNRAETAEAANAAAITAETTRAEAAEGSLQTNINNEAATRAAADTANANAIAAETTRAEAAEAGKTNTSVMPNTPPTNGQLPIGQSASSSYTPTTVGGDGTLTQAGALTVTKTNGTPFAPSATTDTTNAANISSGTLPAARLPGALSSQMYFPEQALTDAASVAWNLNTQQCAKLLTTAAVGATRALANPTNMQAGATYILRVIQSSTGSNALTFGSAYYFPGGTAVTLSTGDNAIDILTFYCDGTYMYCVGQLNFQA